MIHQLMHKSLISKHWKTASVNGKNCEKHRAKRRNNQLIINLKDMSKSKIINPIQICKINIEC